GWRRNLHRRETSTSICGPTRPADLHLHLGRAPKTLATATVDRLLHHAHVCQTSGDSVRLTQALAGKGVTRLN
ncbi:ATP-binding protein, partial [Pseudarthrobacter oxydans]|uniref:ATP-binding protein n=1 Tax=Pseudarthrobacter oxydans TaxID=1671 RepID=UPI00344DCB9A